MKICGRECLECGDTIYSRARHDFRRCTCEAVAVDGGFNYCKVSAKPGSRSKPVEVDVDATVMQLFNDWALRIDKFGVIRAGV